MRTELQAGEHVTMVTLDGSEMFAGQVIASNVLFALVRVVDGTDAAEYAVAHDTGEVMAVFPPWTPLPVLVPLAHRAALADDEDNATAETFGHARRMEG